MTGSERMAPPALAGRGLRAGSSRISSLRPADGAPYGSSSRPTTRPSPREPGSMADLAGWPVRLLPDGSHELEMNPVGYSVDGLGRDALRTDHQPHQVFAAVVIEVTTTCNEC
jgi:hypothetical protein